jgi:tetratricopeptide (TPR) repeat protein
MKKINFITLFLLLSIYLFAQTDNYDKNKRLAEEAFEEYEKKLKENPNSAVPHWEYANKIGQFKFNTHKDAWKYYEKAIEIDSTNYKIYEDYGDYLFERLSSITKAKKIYDKAIELSPNNENINIKLNKISEIISENEKKMALRNVGTSQVKFISHKYSYSNFSNLDSLASIVTNKKNKFFYEKQLKKFMEDKPMSNYEVYLLLIGYTQTENYKPYFNEDLKSLYDLNNRGKFNEAILKGEEALITNPLKPSIYREIMYAYRQLGNNNMAEKYLNKAQIILNSMIYSGDGTCDKPYVTLWTSEEYLLAEYLSLYPTGKQKIESCREISDKIGVYNPKTDEEESLYFNIAPIFKKTMKK